MTKTVYDPLGTAIILTSNLTQTIKIPDSTLRIDATLVITHPVMMFEWRKDSPEKYYIRAFELDTLVLVKVKKIGQIFITDNYILNPSIEHIKKLLERCKQTK